RVGASRDFRSSTALVTGGYRGASSLTSGVSDAPSQSTRFPQRRGEVSAPAMSVYLILQTLGSNHEHGIHCWSATGTLRTVVDGSQRRPTRCACLSVALSTKTPRRSAS